MGQCVAPSWSWASTAGPVEFAAVHNHTDLEEGWFNAITVGEAQCHPLGPDVYGEVSNATIILEAHILTVQVNMPWMHNSNINSSVEILLPTSKGSKSVLQIDDWLPAGERMWRLEGRAYFYPDRGRTGQDMANIRFMPFNKPFKGLYSGETTWIYCTCGNGPMLEEIHSICVECGHGSCGSCEVTNIHKGGKRLHGLLLLAKGGESTYQRVGYLLQPEHVDNIPFTRTKLGERKKITIV
jgi:hypothetical protein